MVFDFYDFRCMNNSCCSYRGVAGFYLRPLISQTFYRFRIWRDQLWKVPTRNGREGNGVGWLRAWARGFMGGAQTNAGFAR